MKKWLIWCLTVLAMVCLIPGIVLKAAAETTTVRCKNCGSVETREILGYRKYDSNSHRVYVAECQNCHSDGNVSYLKVHTGGTETPTCTKGKTCEKCGAEYGEKTQIIMIWCITMQKPQAVRKSAGMLTIPALVVTIPPAKSCPH